MRVLGEPYLDFSRRRNRGESEYRNGLGVDNRPIVHVDNVDGPTVTWIARSISVHHSSLARRKSLKRQFLHGDATGLLSRRLQVRVLPPECPSSLLEPEMSVNRRV